MLIYLDSNVVMYLLENPPVWGIKATKRITSAKLHGDSFAVSDVVRLECRVGPITKHDAALLAKFDAFFSTPGVQIVPLPASVYDRDTQIRAIYSFGVPDSLNLAAAVEAGCNLFLTNDTRLSKFPDAAVEVLT